MNELIVGSPLQVIADYERLPIGTVIGPPGATEAYVKNADGWRDQSRDTEMSLTDFSMGGYNVVRSLPKGGIPSWESLLQWQFRFRDNAFMSAEQAGVSRDTVLRVMTELGIEDDVFPMGRGVLVGSAYDKDRLPVGAQVTVGSPEATLNFGLFVKIRRGGWLHLLGERTDHGNHRVLVVNGEEVGWATTPGTEAEQVALRNFKAQAWRAGWKVKRQNRWCESYEEYMRRIGLTEDVLNDAPYGGSLGERVDPSGAATLPAGSVLRWVSRSDPEKFTWYIRDDNARNEAKTRALFGHRPDGSALRHSATTMEVMWIANQGTAMDLPIDHGMIQYLPVGTRLQTGDGTDLVVCFDHSIDRVRDYVPTSGPWGIDALGTVMITGFPTP